MTADRPTPRSRAPRPAADEGTDPMAAASAVVSTRAAPAPPAPRRGPEPTVQLNVRISAELSRELDAAIARAGTKRAMVERGLRLALDERP